MLVYPHLNPIAFSLGILKVHWYGLMYLVGFLCFIFIGKYRAKKYQHPFVTDAIIDDMLFYMAIGVIAGGRLGYCIFYQPMLYLSHPIEIFKTWNGGMSFHGGMLGVVLAIYVLSRKYRQPALLLGDFVAPIVPIALFFGRIGNFINGELWGRIVTHYVPWAMIYPQSGSMLPRHPSEIYEALGEGVLLAIIMWVYTRKNRYLGQATAVFLMGYGAIRFCLEYFRQPDAFLQAFAQKTGLSMGQWLCIPMVVIGIILYVHASKRKQSIK